MPPRPITGKKPKNLGYTLRTMLSYVGRHKFLFLVVAVLVTVSALANLFGTYMIRPLVNRLADGSPRELMESVALTAVIYLVGALCALGSSTTSGGTCSPTSRSSPCGSSTAGATGTS